MDDDGHDGNEDEAAEQFRDKELPAQQDQDHQPEFDDEVCRREHEREEVHRVGALLEQAFADGDGPETAPTARRAERGRLGQSTQVAIAEDAGQSLFGDVDLDETRDREAHNDRPRRPPEEPDTDAMGFENAVEYCRLHN